MTQPTKVAPDWERIEALYRAGVLSLREIASACGVSHVAISKRAKKFGWVQDLSAKIQAKAEALVTKQQVTSAVTTEQLLTDKAIIDGNAQAIADVRMSHRRDIARGRALCLSLLGELEFTTGNQELFEGLAELLTADGDDKTQAKRMEAFTKAMSGAARIDSMKKLTDTLKTLVGLEREAYGLTVKDEVDDGTVTVEVVRFASD